jgi:hypothetical protein
MVYWLSEALPPITNNDRAWHSTGYRQGGDDGAQQSLAAVPPVRPCANSAPRNTAKNLVGSSRALPGDKASHRGGHGAQAG